MVFTGAENSFVALAVIVEGTVKSASLEPGRLLLEDHSSTLDKLGLVEA